VNHEAIDVPGKLPSAGARGGPAAGPAPADAADRLPPRRNRSAWLWYGLPAILILALLTVVVVVTQRRPAPTSDCASPIKITKAGTYSGCWRSQGGRAAVTIATAEPVRITDSTIKGTGRLITNSVPHAKLTLTNSRLSGVYPGGSGAWADYALWLDGFDEAVIEHNLIEHKGGIKLNTWSGYASSHPVLVRYNRAIDIDGRKTDGAGGYYGHTITQFLQFDSVRNAPGIEIAWNEVQNRPDESAVEDNINLFDSAGTASSPIDIHDNYIKGAYPPRPDTDTKYSGGGIVLGDGGGAWQTARNNQVVSSANYGFAIAGGTNLVLDNNRAVTAGVLPDDRTMDTNVGVVVWNQYSAAFGNDVAEGNVVGWWKARSGSRNDWWLPDCSGTCSNTRLNANAPVTLTDEAAEDTIWQTKLRDAGVTVGPSS